MNDKLFDKILDASAQSCDMVCDLRDLKSCNVKELSSECIYDECCTSMGCLKCMAEIVDWLRSEGVI